MESNLINVEGRKTMNTTRFTLLAIMITLNLRAAAASVGVIVPQDALKFDSDSSSESLNYAGHLQQVFDAKLFANLPPDGALLRGVYFRSDQLFGFNWSGTIKGIEINASTTLKDTSSLSPVFAENIGADSVQLVHPEDFHSLHSGWHSDSTVSNFGIALGTVGAGFFYDPSKGNLLLDVRGLGFPFRLDAFHANQTVAVFPDLFDRNGPRGVLSSDGLTTAFGFFIPEPSSAAMLGLGAGAVMLMGNLNKKRKDSDVTL